MGSIPILPIVAGVGQNDEKTETADASPGLLLPHREETAVTGKEKAPAANRGLVLTSLCRPNHPRVEFAAGAFVHAILVKFTSARVDF